MENSKIAFGILVGILLLCLVVLFTALVVKLFINKVKNYTKLIYEKDLAFQRTLTETILETQEQVLNDISQELHDDAGQQLTYINFMLENLKLDEPEMQQPLEQLSDALATLSNSVRRISHSLSGQMLVQQDLVLAVEAEAKRLQQAKRIEVVFKANGGNAKHIAPAKQIVIFRIFQETINNILKHAQANLITIIIQTDSKFSLTITDNGKGFNYLEMKKTGKGMGLLNIERRALQVGLSATILSSEGRGTSINLFET